jgi:hypothetical protein
MGKSALNLQKKRGVADAEVIIDSTTIEVHRRRGRAKRGSKAISRGDNSEVSRGCNRGRRLVEGCLSGGLAADVTVAARLTEDVIGCTVLADWGCDSDAFRRKLNGNNKESPRRTRIERIPRE